MACEISEKTLERLRRPKKHGLGDSCAYHLRRVEIIAVVLDTTATVLLPATTATPVAARWRYTDAATRSFPPPDLFHHQQVEVRWCRPLSSPCIPAKTTASTLASGRHSTNFNLGHIHPRLLPHRLHWYTPPIGALGGGGDFSRYHPVAWSHNRMPPLSPI